MRQAAGELRRLGPAAPAGGLALALRVLVAGVLRLHLARRVHFLAGLGAHGAAAAGGDAIGRRRRALADLPAASALGVAQAATGIAADRAIAALLRRHAERGATR